jgi:hypothetical protein
MSNKLNTYWSEKFLPSPQASLKISVVLEQIIRIFKFLEALEDLTYGIITL